MIIACSDQIKFFPEIFLKGHLSEMEQHAGLDGDLLTSQNEMEARSKDPVTTEGGALGGCIKRTAKQPQTVCLGGNHSCSPQILEFWGIQPG